jgi:FimV-like protein
MGEPTKALEKVRTEITKDPTNFVLRAELSSLYLRLGKKQEAIENAREMIRKYPDSPAGYIALATVYQSSNEVDRGIETLLNASKSKDAAIAMMLGALYAQKKNYPAALEQIRKAEAAKGRSEQILFQKATLLHAMGKKKEAEIEYQNLLRIAPNHAMALNNLAYLYTDNSNNLNQAYLYATRAFMLAPQNDYVRDTVGYVLLKKGKTDQGMNMLKKAAVGSPNNPNILYHLALAYKESGDPARAAESLQRALSLGDFPESREARALLDTIKKNGKS